MSVPNESRPPAGGFGDAPSDGEIHHRPLPRRPSNALHVVFIIFGLLVAGVGILEAIFAWKKATDVRGAEAKVAIAEIARGVAHAYETTGKLCPSGRAIPQDFERVRGRLYVSSHPEWANDPGWACAGFEKVNPQRYQYTLEVEGDFVTIRAAGDFDSDDVRSQYVLRGHLDVERHRVDFEPSVSVTNPGE